MIKKKHGLSDSLLEASNIIFIGLLFLLFMSLGSCTQRKEENLETHDNLTTQKIKYSDSLFILYTVKAWHNSDGITGVSGFRDYSKLYKMSNDQIKYFLGGTFYSPDRNRIIVWIGEEIPNAATKKTYNTEDSNVNKLCPQGKDTIYSISAIVGFRVDTNTTWKLYPLDIYSAECWDSKNAVISLMRKYYFEQMKNHAVWCVQKKYLDVNFGGKVRYDLDKQSEQMGLSNSDTNSILKNMGYNIQDENFWKKSLIWQKGARVPGYYCFQLDGNGATAIDTLKMPVIKYPDNILKLFK